MGGQSLRETASPLIGQKPETEFVERVRDIVLERPCVRGVHDIVVHDYGHGVRYVTLDVEVPGDLSVTDIHDEIDFAEHQLRKQLGCKEKQLAGLPENPTLPKNQSGPSRTS